jgi:uncharacterized protein YdbL (DUF1318 family)
VELRREIRRLEDLLPRITGEGELREAVRDINQKIAAFNMMSARGKTTVRNEMAQLYAEKLVQRLREGQ